jgi:hypothetical protein
MVSYKSLVLCTNEWLGITIALDNEWLATYRSPVLCTNEWLCITIPLYNEWLATSLWFFTNEWLLQIFGPLQMNGKVSLFLWTVNG